MSLSFADPQQPIYRREMVVSVTGRMTVSPTPTDSPPTLAGPITVEEFNAASGGALEASLSELFGSAELAAAVVAVRPMTDIEEICATASKQLHSLPDDQILTSINAHPPIGGTVAAGSRSAAEQSEAQSDAEALDRLRELQPEYRDHFGFNFLIRAAGLSSQEILDQLTERMGNDPGQEIDIAHRQLDQINQLRLRGFIAEEENK